eukprot:5798789-Alexandrium_andersonii.AAC.1
MKSAAPDEPQHLVPEAADSWVFFSRICRACPRARGLRGPEVANSRNHTAPVRNPPISEWALRH